MSFSSIPGNYRYDKYGNIRVYYPSPYRNDPAWIAYYRTGACGELTSLFGNITNRTGTPVIEVEARFKNGNNHAWVELMMENGEWKYFDPTVYGEHFNFGQWPDDYWFGNTSDYSIFNAKNVLGVYNSKTGDDIMQRYNKLNSKSTTNIKIKNIDVAIDDIQKNLCNVQSLF